MTAWWIFLYCRSITTGRMLRPRNSMPDPELPPIHTVRGQRVVFDSDLAALYGVLTKRLNEAVRRNADRFPEDFCFQLTSEEHARLKSQIVISKPQAIGEPFVPSNWSQIATSSRKHRGAAYRPHAPLGSDVARCTERYRRDQRGRKRPAGILRFESRAAESRTNGIVSCMLRGRPGRFRGTGR